VTVRGFAVLALAVVGALVGFLIARSSVPSAGALRAAAEQLVPNRTWLDHVESNGRSSAAAVLTPPARVHEPAFQAAIAQAASVTGWSRTGTSGAGEPEYGRSDLRATIETIVEPGAAIEATIRVRPHSLSERTAALIGFACGLVAGAVGVWLVGRVRAEAGD
jgi:hypothetical protein